MLLWNVFNCQTVFRRPQLSTMRVFFLCMFVFARLLWETDILTTTQGNKLDCKKLHPKLLEYICWNKSLLYKDVTKDMALQRHLKGYDPMHHLHGAHNQQPRVKSNYRAAYLSTYEYIHLQTFLQLNAEFTTPFQATFIPKGHANIWANFRHES